MTIPVYKVERVLKRDPKSEARSVVIGWFLRRWEAERMIADRQKVMGALETWDYTVELINITIMQEVTA